MKTRLIKKIFKQTYQYRSLKTLKKLLKKQKNIWLNLWTFQKEQNNLLKQRKRCNKEMITIAIKNLDIKNIPF